MSDRKDQKSQKSLETVPDGELEIYFSHDALPAQTKEALAADFQTIAKATNDLFVPGYQNVIDPNLFAAQIDNASLDLKTLDSSHHHRWVASTAETLTDGKLHLMSSIQQFKRSSYPGLYAGVEAMLNTAHPGLANLGLGNAFDVVVKAQSVSIAKGRKYRGLWHDEGLHENIVAVVVYYHDVSAHMQGGAIQFAHKKCMDQGRGYTKDVRRTWQERPKAIVEVKTGSLVVFDNVNIVHRVLDIHNDTDQPVVRSFVCCFLARKGTLPNTATFDQVHSELNPILGDNIADIVSDYLSPVYSSKADRFRLRQVLYNDQMKPKNIGGWMVGTCGNGDCHDNGWSDPNSETLSYGHHQLSGTSDDVASDYDGADFRKIEVPRGEFVPAEQLVGKERTFKPRPPGFEGSGPDEDEDEENDDENKENKVDNQ